MASTATYRVLLCDLRTDQVIDVLPVQDVTLDDYIGKAGSMRGTVPIPDAGLAARARAAILPGRTGVWVERDREIWWGGILWTATPASDDRGRITVEIQAGTVDTYLDHRMVRDTLTAEGVDQFDIVRNLLNYAQSQPGGDLGIEYDLAVSRTPRDRTYSRYDQPIIRDLIDQLAAVEDGFEWRIAAYRDPTTGRRVRRLQLGQPTIRTGAADLVLTHPGPILTYSLPQDATAQANVWQSRGASINANQAAESVPLLSPLLVDDQALTEGWPRLDGSSDYSTVEQQQTLDAHARADAAAAGAPRTIPALTVRLADTGITPQMLGASLRIRIRDLWHPTTLDARFRLVGLSITPPARGSAETATLYLEAA